MPVRMNLSRIIISEINEQQVIYLKEADGVRSFPILIGIFEATSIDRRVKGIRTPRPLTHDLICGVVQAMEGTLQDVLIDGLDQGTYFAKLRIRTRDQVVAVDARPSDAIAVAMTTDPPLPILVSEDVLDEAARSPS